MNNTINQQLNEIIDKLDQLAMRYPELILPSCRAMITEVVYNLHYTHRRESGQWQTHVPVRRVIKDGVDGDAVIGIMDQIYDILGLV